MMCKRPQLTLYRIKLTTYTFTPCTREIMYIWPITNYTQLSTKLDRKQDSEQYNKNDLALSLTFPLHASIKQT